MNLHFRKRERGVGNGEAALTAERDWEIFCVLFLLFFVGVIWWGHSVYGRIERDEFTPLSPRTVSEETGLDRAKLAKTLASFEARRASFAALLQNPLEIAGPGLAPQKKP